MSQSVKEGVLLGIGNPLLDISAEVPTELLEKYGLKLNNAILAEDKHLPLYEEMVNNYPVEYIAGGATQNSIRVAQWMLQTPKATSYIGCVGKDKFGQQLRSSAEADGVAVHYLEDEKVATGTCAVLVNDKERSLVANLAAANHYKPDHLNHDLVRPVWSNAQIIYSAGFFLTVSPAALMFLADHAHAEGKVLCMNLSAPFICQFFDKPLLDGLFYADFLFGNESEAEAFGQKQGYEDCSPEAVALKIAALPKKNAEKPRIVVITQGSKCTIVATEGKATKYDVPLLDQSKIVDVNGAGDAFVGGFLSQLAQGKSIEQCVRAGHYAARTIIQVSGTKLQGKPAPESEW